MSARGLVKSMLLIGSAQGINILLSILRVKVLAVLLGPAGVGLLSIFNNLRETASMGAGLGLPTSGVREIAAARGEAHTLARTRRVLVAALTLQGTLAMLAIWGLRDRLALWLTGETTRALEIGLVGVAVLLFLLSGSQIALLQGMRRIAEMAQVTIYGALAGTLVGIAAVLTMGETGLIWFVLAPPMATAIVAKIYTQRLPKPTFEKIGPKRIWQIWKPMVKLGAAFMLGGLMTTGTLLLVRSLITQELGLDAAGQFAAAWSISITYVGFLLQAMAADYYPRLTEVIQDRVAATNLMNLQAQLALALGGPILLILIGAAPWLIQLLYSHEFTEAGTLVQWQAIGNLFKLASWPLGFAFVAAARSGVFLFLQANFNFLYFVLLWLGLPFMGLQVAGVAFLLAYVLHFIVLNFLINHLHGFRWERLSVRLLAIHGALAIALLWLALWTPVGGAIASAFFALATGLIGGHVVSSKVGSEGRYLGRLASFYAFIGWPTHKTR